MLVFVGADLDDNKISRLKLSDGRIVSLEQALAMCRNKELPAYMISNRNGNEFLKVRNDVLDVQSLNNLGPIV